ncbi:hypothetical protein SO802_026371 [Lithocarpus litseifolius]|uniref:Uncharacterized protein n=1 Tax=Lithocarpus litseifolius TaxID=425828 RepID=A0AAW2BZN3_9ROSI
MTGLQFDGVLIGLENEPVIRLRIDLLGRRYATETIRYTDLETNFMHRPQETAEECLRMAKVRVMHRILVNRIHAHILQTVTLPYVSCKLYHI